MEGGPFGKGRGRPFLMKRGDLSSDAEKSKIKVEKQLTTGNKQDLFDRINRIRSDEVKTETPEATEAKGFQHPVHPVNPVKRSQGLFIRGDEPC